MRTIAVIGLGRFGAALARELAERGVEVLAIDVEGDELRHVRKDVTASTTIDARDPRQLESAGVKDVDAAVVAIGEAFEAAQECVLALKKLGVKRIIGRAQTHDRGRILEKIGAHQVVSPEVESAKRVAYALDNPLILDGVDIGHGTELVTMTVPAHATGRTLAEIKPTTQWGVLIVKVVRQPAEGRTEVIVPPRADTQLQAGDELTVMGPRGAVQDFAAD